jgi:hypothetical protein
MRGHVLITNKETFPVVRDNSFWGLFRKGIPNTFEELIKKDTYIGLTGDMLGTRIDDIVFFYEMGAGFHGIYRIISRPFFDPTPVECVNNDYPLRVELSCLNYFPEPVPEAYLFSTKEYESRFWVWFYRKIRGAWGGGVRGVNTINPEAVEGLIELLVKINGNAIEGFPSREYPSRDKVGIYLPITDEGRVKYESILRAWLISEIDDPENSGLREIFGPVEDLEWFANNVPYHVSGNNIDILCYHQSNKYTGFPIRYKYTVVELKRDNAGEGDVTQVIEYSKWVAGRLAGSEIETIQPVLIAYKFKENAIQKAANSDFNDRGVNLFSYKVENNYITFNKVEY